MAYFTDVHSAHRSSGFLSTLTERYEAWRHYRDTLAELRQLSPRELNDMGIGTADFDDIAHGRPVQDRLA